MQRIIWIGAVLMAPLLGSPVWATTTYALSPDGNSVVRLVPQGTAAASSLSVPLPGGYTTTTGSQASPTVTTYAAGFPVSGGGNGGANFEALYNNGAALSAGESLNWVQTVDSNVPIQGATSSPHLDNTISSATRALPFYSYTGQNRDSSLPANEINFYDYSVRSPSSLSTTDPITWNASLYPVIATAGSKVVTVENGVTWGWTMKNAPVGSTTAKFVSPSGGVVTGVGTNSFAWGVGDPSSLTFAGTPFNTKVGNPFSLGQLTFYNGTIDSGTEADSVALDLALSSTNIPEKNFDLKTTLNLINAPNTSNPITSADQVVVSGYGYTFNVLEGATASVNLMGELNTTLTGIPSGTEPNASDTPVTFSPSPNYDLTLLGFADPSAGGFTTSVPEPASLTIFGPGLLLLLWFARRRTLLAT